MMFVLLVMRMPLAGCLLVRLHEDTPLLKALELATVYFGRKLKLYQTEIHQLEPHMWQDGGKPTEEVQCQYTAHELGWSNNTGFYQSKIVALVLSPDISDE